MEFVLALQFLTRLPVSATGAVDGRMMARSMAYFSFVGLLIGGTAAALNYALGLLFSPILANLGTIVFMVSMTGNLHGDGLMDTVDGIFSGRPRERMLEIMRDSRVGAHGVMAGILSVLLKFVLLGEIGRMTVPAALITASTLGRWAQVYGAARCAYVRSDGSTGSFTDHVGRRELIVNSLVAAGSALLLFKLVGVALLVIVFIVTVLFFEFIKGKLGGITGDTLGAANETVEISTLLVIVFFASFHLL